MDLHDITITQAAKGFRNKSFSALELTQNYFDRIKAIDGKIQSFVTLTENYALQKAKEADKKIAGGDDRVLLGIPLSIKDNFNTKGHKTTASSSVLSDFISPFSATVVEKLENAGTVMLGKTNMDAWAHGSSTETSDFFTTKNPWNIETLPGGSSGGSAASIAADEALASIGSETAGSVRGPASWCGVIGFKPTYGRVSRYGVVAMASSLDSPGPITKTVEDTAIILEAIAGKDIKDATTSSLPVKPYSKLMKENKKMTIGIADDYFEGVDAEVVASVQDALKVLEKAGHTIKKIDLFDPQYAIDVYTILMRSEVSSNLARYDGIRYGNNRSNFGQEAKRRIMLGTYVLSAGYYDAYYLKAQKVRTLIIEDFARAYKEVDVIIGPTLPTPALQVGATQNEPMFGEKADVLVEPSSIAGLCGINMPVGFTKEGLPIGMQIIGNHFAEEVVLDIAYQYEKETNWRSYKPNL